MIAIGDVEVDESKSTTFEDGESSTSMKNLDVVGPKCYLTRTSSMDSCVSQGKKLKVGEREEYS